MSNYEYLSKMVYWSKNSSRVPIWCKTKMDSSDTMKERSANSDHFLTEVCLTFFPSSAIWGWYIMNITMLCWSLPWISLSDWFLSKPEELILRPRSKQQCDVVYIIYVKSKSLTKIQKRNKICFSKKDLWIFFSVSTKVICVHSFLCVFGELSEMSDFTKSSSFDI